MSLATKYTYGWQPPEIKMLQQVGKLIISDNGALLTIASCTVRLTVINPSNEQQSFRSSVANEEHEPTSHEYEIDLPISGEYQIKFHISGQGQTIDDWVDITATTYIYVNPDNSSLKPYTLGDTIRRLLSLTPTRTKGEPPKYTFNAEQLAEYDKEESPEFAFTGHTLFEALLLVAQYKGAFPELKGNEISFRKMWNGVRLKESDLPPSIDDISITDIDMYCTYLETEVQNLVGINDSRTGTIVEPYANGYKTTRAASGSVISQDTAVISTDYDQYLHIKENIGYIGNELPPNGDITAYVYESGDYNALSDKSASYPGSKAYALKWTQMGKNIEELAHRTEGASSLANAFKQPALANIIHAKTDIDYDAGIVGYISNLIDPKSSGNSFADLMFRTTYIPIINARIKQYRDNFADFHHDGSIKYNQTAELVDSEMYGEHLKELLRKMGHATKSKVYIFDKIDDVPDVGTVVDGYSIYDIQMSIRENKVVATIAFVKYAELSKYIGVKNPWKDSDVSVDKCYNRQISYNEFLLFTHDGDKKSTSKIFSESTDDPVPKLKRLFPDSAHALTCVEATGYTKEGEKLNTVLLPVVSLAIGNSIMFQWQYQNNFSAGYMSEEAPEGATSLLSGTVYNRAQKAVKYADMYGKMETYSFSLMPSGPVPVAINNEISNMVWVENGTAIKTPDKVYRNIGNSLPLKPPELKSANKSLDGEYVAWQGQHYISVNDLVVEKNSSEALTFSLQLHFCTDDENFIIGSGMSNYCPLIGSSTPALCAGIVAFKDRINIFNRRISITNGEILSDNPTIDSYIEGDNLRAKITVSDKINDKDENGEYIYNSWAYVVGKEQIYNNKGGTFQIIFGENRDINGSAFNTELYLLPMHKLEDFI